MEGRGRLRFRDGPFPLPFARWCGRSWHSHPGEAWPQHYPIGSEGWRTVPSGEAVQRRHVGETPSFRAMSASRTGSGRLSQGGSV